MPDVARPLVAAAPAMMPALVHEPPTASRTSAEMSLGAAATSGCATCKKVTQYLMYIIVIRYLIMYRGIAHGLLQAGLPRNRGGVGRAKRSASTMLPLEGLVRSRSP
jgi:hypothetical protein